MAFLARGEKPSILTSTRTPIELDMRSATKNLRAKTLDALKNAAKKAFDEYQNILSADKDGLPLSHIHVFYGSPWQDSRPVSVYIKRKAPFVVTPRFLQSVVAKEETDFQKKHAEDAGKPLMVDNAILGLTLNGYPVENPYQKNVLELSCSIFMSVVEESFVKDVERIIHNAFHVREIGRTALPLAYISVMRNLVPKDKDFLVACTGEEVTELSHVSAGVLETSVTFPAGVHALARSLSGKAGGSAAVALSLTRLHVDEHNEPEWTGVVSAHIAEVSDLWKQQYETACKQLSQGAPLPKTVFVMGEKTSSELFRTAISGGDQSVLPFDEENMADSFGQTSAANDALLMAESLFLMSLERHPLSRV